MFSFDRRSRFVHVGWIWDRRSADPRYVSDRDVDWEKVLKVIKESGYRSADSKVGLLNFNGTEVNSWRQLLPTSEFVVVDLNSVDASLRWEDLYPEWIDEEEEFEVPKCPSLPEPRVTPTDVQLDLIAVKLPCNSSGGWSRDVVRLHLQLAAAKLAASASAGALHGPQVLFLTDCFPLPNLFRCKDLVAREGSLWLYRPSLPTLRESVELPVGSCTLSVPLKADGQLNSSQRLRRAISLSMSFSADSDLRASVAVFGNSASPL